MATLYCMSNYVILDTEYMTVTKDRLFNNEIIQSREIVLQIGMADIMMTQRFVKIYLEIALKQANKVGTQICME